MKNIILDIIKGSLIGIANVIPGVSGGTIAVSTGVYQKIINAISNIRKDFKNSFKTLWPFIIGMVIGIATLSFVIIYLLENFTVPTVALFIGLVLGGVGPIVSKLDGEKIKWTHIVSFIITLAIIIIPTVVAVNTVEVSDMTLDIGSILMLVLFGIVSASAMVIPGVSGSMVLMILRIL